MHVKLLFHPETALVLGAQIAGFDGVDKRIDVFAMAIRAKMTVFDLEHLELAYAPPYGSAKDPVNMAGFIASNFLRGDLDLWYAEDFPDKTATGTLLDVRGEKEFANWHIPGAINIPLGQLRTRLNEINKGQPVYIYCRVGFRSYLAYRILIQHGFSHALVLSGGTKTFNCYCCMAPTSGGPGVPFVSHAEEKMAEKPGALKNH
jgi:rhodanese-related sulfurtransferase